MCRPARRLSVVLCLALALTFSACGTLEVGIEQTAAPPTAAAGVEATATVPASPSPTEDGATEPAPAPTEDLSSVPVEAVEVYLVAVGDDGQGGERIGCGDSLIPVTRQIAPTTEPLRSALEELLSIHEQFYGESGLYNALYQSDLVVESIERDGGSATIRLRGRMQLGGVCDNPRFEAQLLGTANQFEDVGEVSILINDVPLEQAISLK
jgi:hypothetical protein